MKNTIAQISQIIVKPKHWHARETQEGNYVLFFCHLDTDDWIYYCPVQNARGKTKIYKTIPALLKDVRSVDENATLTFKLAPLSV